VSHRGLIVLLGSYLLVPVTTAQAQILFGAIGSSSSTSDLYTVDPATAGTTPIGPIGFSVTGLSTHPFTGTLYGVTAGGGGAAGTRRLITINTATGAGTSVGFTNTRIPDISFRSNGVLYGWDEPSNDDLITIDTVTAATTIVGNSGLSTAGSGLDFSPGGVLYFAGNGAAGDLRTVDPDTGATIAVATLSGAPPSTSQIAALAFHPVTGVLYGVALEADDPDADAFLITINTGTGAITTIGQLPDRFDALGWEVSAVPAAPGGALIVLALFLAGLAVVMLRRRPQLA
jgi:hypothetical protein